MKKKAKQKKLSSPPPTNPYIPTFPIINMKVEEALKKVPSWRLS